MSDSKYTNVENASEQKADEQRRVFACSYGSFFRSLELPTGTDLDKIKAIVSKGVLKVTIEKPAASEAKKIEINAA